MQEKERRRKMEGRKKRKNIRTTGNLTDFTSYFHGLSICKHNCMIN